MSFSSIKNIAESSSSSTQALSQSSSLSSSSSSAVDSTVRSAALPVLSSQPPAPSAKKSQLPSKQWDKISTFYPPASKEAVLNFFGAVVESYKSNGKSSALEAAFEELKKSDTHLKGSQIQMLARQARAMCERNKAFDGGKNGELSAFLDAKSVEESPKETPVVIKDFPNDSKTADSSSSTTSKNNRPLHVEVPEDAPKGNRCCWKAALRTSLIAAGLLNLAYYLFRSSPEVAPAIRQPVCLYSEAPLPQTLRYPMSSPSAEPLLSDAEVNLDKVVTVFLVGLGISLVGILDLFFRRRQPPVGPLPDPLAHPSHPLGPLPNEVMLILDKQEDLQEIDLAHHLGPLPRQKQPVVRCRDDLNNGQLAYLLRCVPDDLNRLPKRFALLLKKYDNQNESIIKIQVVPLGKLASERVASGDCGLVPEDRVRSLA